VASGDAAIPPHKAASGVGVNFEPQNQPVDLAREAAFTLGVLEIRPATREAVAGETAEVLEPRVMQVLVALARRRGEVVSRDELILSCWGGRAVGDDAINRCIARIRRLAESESRLSAYAGKPGEQLEHPGGDQRHGIRKEENPGEHEEAA